ASRFRTDGIYDFNNEYRNDALSGRIRFEPDARTDATLTVRYGSGELHYPTHSGGEVVDRNPYQLDDRLTPGFEPARRLTDRRRPARTRRSRSATGAASSTTRRIRAARSSTGTRTSSRTG